MSNSVQKRFIYFFCLEIQRLIYSQTLFDKRIRIDWLASLFIRIWVNSNKFIVSTSFFVPQKFIMRHVIEYLKEKSKCMLSLFVIRNILIDDLDLSIFDKMRIGFGQFLFYSFAKWRWNLNNSVLELRKQLSMKITEEIYDRLCRTSCPRSCFDNSNLFFLSPFSKLFLMRCF